MATSGSRQDRLNKLAPVAFKAKLGDVLYDLVAANNAMRARLVSSLLSSAGLAITAGGSAVVKAATAFAAIANGTLVNKAADTAMAALVGTIAGAGSDDFAAWPFYVNSAGTLTTGAKTANVASHAAAIAALPETPDGLALIGFIVVQNAIAANADFVGGTTALDAVGVTVTYYNTPGHGIFKGAAVTDIDRR